MSRIPRLVEPELLDSLPADDPAAMHSRRDLQRLNVLMGQAPAIARALEAHGASRWMRRVADLGGGDGTLLLQVARRLAVGGAGVQGVVVDRHPALSPSTRAGFLRAGWGIDAIAGDALEWLGQAPSREGTVVIANLFLHHFEDGALRALLARIADAAELLVACEPRRSPFTLVASRRVGWIGCNAVTRHDATVSVRAGFAGHEISGLWPAGAGWEIEEGPAGLFSHSFVARRRDH